MSGAAEMARELRHALDPALFARERLGITPDPWQERILKTSAKRVILTCSRQSGKSTTAAILAVHQAIYHPGSLILMVSPTQRQSSELFGKARHFIGLLPAAPKLVSDGAMACKFATGSRIVALPGDAAGVRGYSAPRLVIADESAFTPDDLFVTIQPMLAVSNGALWLMSTPNGRQGFHYNVWTDGGDDWHRESITADQCPRITPEFLAEEERLNGPHYMRTEYRCEFLEGTHQYFSDEAIRAVLSDAVPRLDLVF